MYFYVFLFRERGPWYSPVIKIMRKGNSIVSGDVTTNCEVNCTIGAGSNLTIKERMAILDDMKFVVGNESDSD